MKEGQNSFLLLHENTYNKLSDTRKQILKSYRYHFFHNSAGSVNGIVIHDNFSKIWIRKSDEIALTANNIYQAIGRCERKVCVFLFDGMPRRFFNKEILGCVSSEANSSAEQFHGAALYTGSSADGDGCEDIFGISSWQCALLGLISCATLKICSHALNKCSQEKEEKYTQKIIMENILNDAINKIDPPRNPFVNKDNGMLSLPKIAQPIRVWAEQI